MRRLIFYYFVLLRQIYHSLTSTVSYILAKFCLPENSMNESLNYETYSRHFKKLRQC